MVWRSKKWGSLIWKHQRSQWVQQLRWQALWVALIKEISVNYKSVLNNISQWKKIVDCILVFWKQEERWQRWIRVFRYEDPGQTNSASVLQAFSNDMTGYLAQKHAEKGSDSRNTVTHAFPKQCYNKLLSKFPAVLYVMHIQWCCWHTSLWVSIEPLLQFRVRRPLCCWSFCRYRCKTNVPIPCNHQYPLIDGRD